MEKPETLKEIKGYTDEELGAISQIAYFMMMQGKYREARILFEALVAIEPSNEYNYRALGVLAQHEGDSNRALEQFGYAIQLASEQPQAYVNRAEIHLSEGNQEGAEQDLQAALMCMGRQDRALSRKAWALYRNIKFEEV
ncbi:MAG: CesD/SycD/LcrH family type III secretion system chaperone [Myxococcaceae bacterium]|nr:CesD/SycD/LcrH family type III secretion system chaperone [Myxococcaceae bacterium]MBH2006827.1 CesD/SycD/LcrH family type III secretion system chaperone [Myxococcaceae bacterium]